MSPVAWALLKLALTVVAYFVLLSLGRRIFTGRFRAEGAAAAIVIAFIIGSDWPYTQTESPALSELPPVIVNGNLSADPTRETGQLCAKARLGSGAGKGNLDSVRARRTASAPSPIKSGAAIQLDAADELLLNGWAADSVLPRSALGACAVVDGAIFRGNVHVSYGAARPDVATALNNALLASSGFQIVIRAALIAPGEHRLQVASISADGTASLVGGIATIVAP